MAEKLLCHPKSKTDLPDLPCHNGNYKGIISKSQTVQRG